MGTRQRGFVLLRATVGRWWRKAGEVEAEMKMIWKKSKDKKGLDVERRGEA